MVSTIGKSHPVEPRSRAVALVAPGNTRIAAARRLWGSIRFGHDMVRLTRETGVLSPKPQGNPGRGTRTGVSDWVRCGVTIQPGLAIDAPAAELAADRGLPVHRASVGRLLLRRRGPSHT